MLITTTQTLDMIVQAYKSAGPLHLEDGFTTFAVRLDERSLDNVINTWNENIDVSQFSHHQRQQGRHLNALEVSSTLIQNSSD